jgi:DNA polymerase-3 subunit delta'
VLLDEPESMDAPAANALLKTLEEPPRSTVLLLVSSAPGRLLPTIRSRCRRLDLAPLADAPMRGLLARWLPELDADGRERLLGLAEGAPGRALALAEGQGLEFAELADETLANLARADALALAERVAGRDSSGFATFLALLVRAVQVAAREAGQGGRAAPWLGARPLHQWAEAASEVARLAGAAERLSLDKAQCVIEAVRLLRGPA